MPGERIDIESFLNEMVSALDRRLKQQDRAIRRLEREVSKLKASADRGVNVDESVLKVLRGK
jgi:hypothetical protein